MAEKDFQKQQLEGMMNRSKTKADSDSPQKEDSTEDQKILFSIKTEENQEDEDDSQMMNNGAECDNSADIKYEENMIEVVSPIVNGQRHDNSKNDANSQHEEIMKNYELHLSDLEKRLKENNSEMNLKIEQLGQQLIFKSEIIERINTENKLLKDENLTLKKQARNQVEVNGDDVSLNSIKCDTKFSQKSKDDSAIVSNGVIETLETQCDTSNLNRSKSESQEEVKLRDKCVDLDQKIKASKEELERTKSENKILQNQCFDYQKSLEQLQKTRQTNGNASSQTEQNLSTGENEHIENRLQVANNKILELESKCESYKDNIYNMDELFESMRDHYDNLNLKTKVISYVSMIPLSLLIMAIMIAFYPTLATITATGI